MEYKDFMLAALELAKEAAADGEVPVGCVITRRGNIVVLFPDRGDRYISKGLYD